MHYLYRGFNEAAALEPRNTYQVGESHNQRGA